MAAKSVSRGIGKLFLNRFPEPSLRHLVTVGRRGVHTSVYDKNVDDQARPANVPDDLIEPQSDKYWAPNPHTGVFGPANEQSGATAKEGKYNAKAGDASETVLEQQAWFRPLENIDKPQQP